MPKNVGGLDRNLRLVLGAILIVAGLFLPSLWWLTIVGLVPIFTALIGFCPAYLPFGINTAKAKQD